MISTHSKLVSVSTANILLVLVSLDLQKNELNMDAYYTSVNKHYRSLMAVMQRAAVVPTDLMEKYTDGKLISQRKIILRVL